LHALIEDQAGQFACEVNGLTRRQQQEPAVRFQSFNMPSATGFFTIRLKFICISGSLSENHGREFHGVCLRRGIGRIPTSKAQMQNSANRKNNRDI